MGAWESDETSEASPYASRFEELRWERGLTVAEAARGMGVSKSTLRDFELLHARSPRPPIVTAVAQFYGLTVAEVLHYVRGAAVPA